MKKIIPLLIIMSLFATANATAFTDTEFTGAEFLVPVAESLGKEIIPLENRVLTLPFETNTTTNRAAVDLPVTLDVSGLQTFALDWECDTPEAVDFVLFYFKSGDGWYSMSGSRLNLSENQFRSMFTFEKSRTEGKPGPKSEVSTIRIAFYAGKRVNSQLTLRSLRGNGPEKEQSPHARLLAKWREGLRLGWSPEQKQLPFVEARGREILGLLTEKGWETREIQTLLGNPDSDPVRVESLTEDLSTILDKLRLQFCSNFQPLPGERRFIWEHSGMGIEPGNWDATMKLLHDTGFTGIIVNQCWGGSADYTSDVLPRSSIFTQYGDQIQQAIDAGRRHGVEVHVWKVNFNLGYRVPPEFVEKMRSEGRLQKSFTGEEERWLCPSDPRNQELEVASLLEIAQKYAVDGIHMDYIRYPDGDHCFCAGCRARFGAFFERETGKALESDGRVWPGCVRDPAVVTLWQRWRCDNITRVVRSVYHGVKEIRPEIEISAAVASQYPGSLPSRAQDWVAWGHEGILDFACPMDYTESHTTFENYVENQVFRIEGCIPVYPGIGVYSSGSRMSADGGAVQIGISRRWKTGGFVFFSLNKRTAKELLPFFEKK